MPPADGSGSAPAQSRQRLQVRVLDPRIGRDFPLPQYATAGSAGVDLRACIDTAIELRPGDTHLIPSGIAIYLADPTLAADAIEKVLAR